MSRDASIRGLILQRQVFVARHAVDRLREHHPTLAGWYELLHQHLAPTIEVDPGVAKALCGRRGEPPPWAVNPTRFFLATDHRGLFVVEIGWINHLHSACCRTYLRFGPAQQELAARLYPEAGRVEPAEAPLRAPVPST